MKEWILALVFLGALPAGAQTNLVPETKRACCREVQSAAPLSDRSVYQLTSDWTDDAGHTMKLGRLRGKPQVVAMFFSSCRGSCPIIVHEMQALAESLPAGIRTNVGFLLVTFDGEHDTSEALHAYRAARNLDDQWTLLHGRGEDINELAMVLGVKYRKGADGQFSHSNVITILNAEGEIAFQQNGLEAGGSELAKKLSRLVDSR